MLKSKLSMYPRQKCIRYCLGYLYLYFFLVRVTFTEVIKRETRQMGDSIRERTIQFECYIWSMNVYIWLDMWLVMPATRQVCALCWPGFLLFLWWICSLWQQSTIPGNMLRVRTDTAASAANQQLHVSVKGAHWEGTAHRAAWHPNQLPSFDSSMKHLSIYLYLCRGVCPMQSFHARNMPVQNKF